MQKYTQQFKNEIIEFRKTHSLKETKDKYKISHTTIRAWTTPENKEKQNKQQRDYYRRNIEKARGRAKTRNKIRYQNDKEKCLEKNHQYFIKNKDHIKQITKEYYNKNKKHLNKMSYERHKKKCQEDPSYKLSTRLRGRIKNALLTNNYAKQDKTYNLIGCTPKFLKTYLESLFQSGMTWDNYGRNGWHIDHIIPCSKFDLNKKEEQKKCFHYTNLQPLWAIDNLKKGVKTSIYYKPHLSAAYTPQECKTEYDKYQKDSGSYGPLQAFNRIVLTYQPHYYEKEKQLWLENKNDLRRKLINNRIKYIQKDEYTLSEREILRGFKISSFYRGFTHFNPLWLKGFIEEFNIKSVYDFCGGWGHRLIGSGDIQYIYNDLDSRTYEGCKKIALDFNMQNKIFYNQDCRTFTPKENYEAVFTCPPYYNTEIYNDKKFKSINDFEDFIGLAIKASVKDSVKIVGIVINGQYANILKEQAIKNKLRFIKEIPLGLKFNHFQKTSKNSYKTEAIYVFDK
jgi:hypothetical protein